MPRDLAIYPNYPHDRAYWHLNRAAQTEGVSEGGLRRTALVESAAAITVTLFSVADSIEYFAKVARGAAGVTRRNGCSPDGH